MLRVYVLEKVKTIFYFSWSFTKMVDGSFFREKWTHCKKIYKGRLSFFYLDGTFWTPADLQKSQRDHCFEDTNYFSTKIV